MEACLKCESLQQNSSLLQIPAPRILFSLLPFTWLLLLHFDSSSCTYPPMGTIFALKEANYLVLTSVLLVSFIPSCDSAPETPAEFRIPFTHHPSLQHHLTDKLELLFSNSREYEELWNDAVMHTQQHLRSPHSSPHLHWGSVVCRGSANFTKHGEI